MSTLYKDDAIQLHEKGEFHIHDLNKNSGYSIEISLEQLLELIYPEKIVLKPTNHEFEYISELIQELQIEWPGQIRINIKLHEENSWVEFFQKLNANINFSEKNNKNIFLKFDFDENYTDSIKIDESKNKSMIDSACNPVFLLNNSFWKDKHTEIFGFSSMYGLPLFETELPNNEDTDINEIFDMNLGLITLNLSRAAYVSENENEFYDYLYELVNLAVNALEHKKNNLLSYTATELLPLTKRLFGIPGKYSTSLGIVGLHEALMSLIGKGIETIPGKAVAYKILEEIKNRTKEIGDENGYQIKLWATPTNHVSARLASLDRKLFPDSLKIDTKIKYYTGSSELPLGYTDDLWDALEHQKKLLTYYDGGNVFNVPLEETIHLQENCRRLVEKIDSVFKIPAFAISPNFSWCKTHGYLCGAQEKCPKGNGVTEVYTRLNGVLRKVSSMNALELEVYKSCRPYGVAKGV